MGLTPKFTDTDIRNLIKQKFERIEEAVLTRLQRVGETFITDARNNGTYTDRTGNLRSSIGYVVLKNGEQYYRGGFEPIKTGAEGSARGKKVLLDAISRFPTGYVLIVVAGMSYAAAVEAHGRDVLTGSSQSAVIELKRVMERIKKNS
jgi:hypothetical protein